MHLLNFQSAHVDAHIFSHSKNIQTKPNRVRRSEPADESQNNIEEENVNDLSDSDAFKSVNTKQTRTFNAHFEVL